LTPIVSEDRSLLLGAHRVRARTAPLPAAAPVFATVRRGLGFLAARVAEASGTTVHTGVIARELARTATGWQLGGAQVGGGARIGPLAADAVVLAVPAGVARELLTPVAPYAAAALAGVPYASVGLVTLVYSDVRLPPGSGFLVPARQGTAVKAVTFLSG